MNLLVPLVASVIPLLVGLYTFNYARWATKQKLRRASIGLYLLAFAAVGVPYYVLFFTGG